MRLRLVWPAPAAVLSAFVFGGACAESSLNAGSVDAGQLDEASSGGSGGTSPWIDGASIDSPFDPNAPCATECIGKTVCYGGSCRDACEVAALRQLSVGCEYYAVNMDAIDPAVGGCFVSFVANTFAEAANITVQFKGQPLDLAKFAKIPVGSGKSLTYAAYDPTQGLAPDGVAILFLANSPTEKYAVQCPVPAAIESGAQVLGTGRGSAFQIETDVPVVAYQMLPYGGGSAAITGATLLLPTSAWHTNYVAVNGYEHGAHGASMNLVAAKDGTQITLLPKVDIVGGNGVAAAAAGSPVTYALDAGEVLQITQPEELTGSPIESNKPIGLWAGHRCALVPTDRAFCDHLEQQIPPVRALGSEYVVVPPRKRAAQSEPQPRRIIGAVDGTQLTFEPDVGGPASIDSGQVVEFRTDEPFVVRSQDADHPFLVLSYMSGLGTNSSFHPGEGDPDVVRIVPPKQYLKRYVFFTDPTYPETNLVVVRQKGENGFAAVQLGCAGILQGWTPVGSAGMYEYALLDLVSGDFQPQNGCDNGRHEMSSDEPFGLWVWGWGSRATQGDGPCDIFSPNYTCWVSYGYPAGEGVVPINTVEVPAVPR
jgi:hypothetical protein